MIKFIKKIWERGDIVKAEDINRWEDGIFDAHEGLDSHITDNTKHLVNGNANTANKLQTPRQINGTNFDGSANITTATWGRMRAIAIGHAVRFVDGTENITFPLKDIGAMPAETNGTWTPIITLDRGEIEPRGAYIAQEGRWQKIGDRVFISGYVYFEYTTGALSHTPALDVHIANLPFVVANANDQISVHNSTRLVPSANSLLQTRVHGIVAPGTNFFNLHSNNARLNQIRGTANSEGVVSAVLRSDHYPIAGDIVYRFSGSYTTN